jgi:hypothetical protein
MTTRQYQRRAARALAEEAWVELARQVIKKYPGARQPQVKRLEKLLAKKLGAPPNTEEISKVARQAIYTARVTSFK